MAALSTSGCNGVCGPVLVLAGLMGCVLDFATGWGAGSGATGSAGGLADGGVGAEGVGAGDEAGDRIGTGLVLLLNSCPQIGHTFCSAATREPQAGQRLIMDFGLCDGCELILDESWAIEIACTHSRLYAIQTQSDRVGLHGPQDKLDMLIQRDA